MKFRIPSRFPHNSLANLNLRESSFTVLSGFSGLSWLLS